jgi:hypothetical protein
MTVGSFRSSNGRTVRIAVEIRSEAGVFGKDFVTGGLRDYAAKYQQGYWITTKSPVYPSNVDQLLREAIQNALGSPPATMPETYASHLVVHIWDGPPPFSEDQLRSKIGEKMGRSEITLDEERINRTRTKEIAELKNKVESARAPPSRGEVKKAFLEQR